MNKYDARTERITWSLRCNSHNTTHPIKWICKIRGKKITLKLKKAFSHTRTHTPGEWKRSTFTNYMIFATHNIMATRLLSSHSSAGTIDILSKSFICWNKKRLNKCHTAPNISLTFCCTGGDEIPSFSSKLLIFSIKICATENQQSYY